LVRAEFRMPDTEERSVEMQLMTIRRMCTGPAGLSLRALSSPFIGPAGVGAAGGLGLRSATGNPVWGVAGNGGQIAGGRVSARGSAM
jgi:hypothetical protein